MMVPMPPSLRLPPPRAETDDEGLGEARVVFVGSAMRRVARACLESKLVAEVNDLIAAAAAQVGST